MAAVAIFDFIKVPFLRRGWTGHKFFLIKFGMLVQTDTLK